MHIHDSKSGRQIMTVRNQKFTCGMIDSRFGYVCKMDEMAQLRPTYDNHFFSILIYEKIMCACGGISIMASSQQEQYKSSINNEWKSVSSYMCVRACISPYISN